LIAINVTGPAASIATFCNWGFGFLLTKTFDDMSSTMTPAGAFWLFAAFCFVGVIFTAFFLPETKGKTYNEIQDFFGNNEAKPDANQKK
jgi:Sugar (and other) transporter